MKPRRLLYDDLLHFGVDPQISQKSAVLAEGRAYSYGELLSNALGLASALRAHGVVRGDRVAIYMDNTWPCVVSIYGVLLAGAVFVLVNPQTKADKLAFVLSDAGAGALITDGHLASEFGPASTATPGLKVVICSGELPAGVKTLGFDAAIAAVPTTSSLELIPLDLAALIYTSGSTGNPKGVMQTHLSMRFALESLTEYLRLQSDDRILLVLPLAFDYGLYQLLMTVGLGATLVLERSFTFPAQVYNRMRSERVTVFPAVPTIFSMLLSSQRREPLSFPDVRRVTNTAAALPDDYVPHLKEIFPNALIYRMYGLTECKRVSYLEPELTHMKPGSVGKAIPGTEVYLLNGDGTPTPRGEVGILHVRGLHVMLGYWNQPELTAHMLRPGRLPGERVLCTHDHFRMDEEGYLYFVGRTDDIIKSRGEKVSPVEVENVLHGMPGVREAVVVGVADDTLGQAIRAYVALDEGAALSEKQIRAWCAARLESFMVPREVVFKSELPRTATGKLSRRALIEQS